MRPCAMSTMPPMLRLVPVAMNTATMNGKMKLAGKLARTCTSGCAERATRGLMPIFTPIGTQISVADDHDHDDPQERVEAEHEDVRHARRTRSVRRCSADPGTRPRPRRRRRRPRTRRRRPAAAGHRLWRGCSASPNGRVTRSRSPPTGCSPRPSARGQARAAQRVVDEAAGPVGRLGRLVAELLRPRDQRPPEEEVHAEHHDDHHDDRQQDEPEVTVGGRGGDVAADPGQRVLLVQDADRFGGDEEEPAAAEAHHPVPHQPDHRLRARRASRTAATSSAGTAARPRRAPGAGTRASGRRRTSCSTPAT